MNTASRTAATLGVLVAIVVAWAVWGFAQTTRPFPSRQSAPTCVDTTVPADSRVEPRQVTVSVLNAGTREGLAGRTMQQFVDAGFGRGGIDNAPAGTEVATAQIWTTDRRNPAVRLLRSRIPDVRVVEQEADEPGVTVVVGDGFGELVAGRESVRVRRDAVVCVPGEA